MKTSIVKKYMTKLKNYPGLLEAIYTLIGIIIFILYIIINTIFNLTE